MSPSPHTISSPLRILILSPPSSPPLPLFKDSETYPIHTPYNTASPPLWRDSLPLTSSALSAWKSEWLAPEAAEVVSAIGAWVLCLPYPSTDADLLHIRNVLRGMKDVIEKHTDPYSDGGGGGAEPLTLALVRREGRVVDRVGDKEVVGGKEMGTEEWEDLCRDAGGWEWVDGDVEGEGKVNEFGERVGLDRVKEALEAGEWEGGGDEGLGIVDGREDEGDQGEPGLEDEVEEMEEVEGLREGLLSDRTKGEDEIGENVEGEESDLDRDEDVQALESMMLKMQAVRDMGADMPESERKKFAAKAVREVMRTL